jgi:protein-L-isoaspartate O-methyltransferase
MKDESMLNFYRSNKVSPVRQEINNYHQHFERREALYRHLGILPGSIWGKTVLEVGPGSGYNSLYTASLKPERLILLEPNPQGVKDIHNLFGQYPSWQTIVTVIPKTIEEFQVDTTYDFVFCEGLLGAAGTADPGLLFKSLTQFVSPRGGVLVITCTDEVAYLSDLLRRLFGQMLLTSSKEEILNEKIIKLLPVFTPHLKHLKGMTRRYDDWIIDTIVNPASCGRLFTIFDALTAVSDEFEFYGSSPHFVSDWRWYKSIQGKDKDYNQRALQQYWMNLHNLMDYRFTFPARDVISNKELYNWCCSLRKAIQQYENGKSMTPLKQIEKYLQEIIVIVNEFSQETANALSEALNLLNNQPFEGHEIAEMKKFAPFFGRGQQYISFTRRFSKNI